MTLPCIHISKIKARIDGETASFMRSHIAFFSSGVTWRDIDSDCNRPNIFLLSMKSGFGLLPDIVPAWAQGRCEEGAAIWRWTSTRYACPRRERRENRKNSDLAMCGKISITPMLVLKRYFADSVFFGSCITDFGGWEQQPSAVPSSKIYTNKI